MIRPATAKRPIAFETACRVYVHRFTMEHVPDWAKERRPTGKYYAPQYRSDREWYERTTFPGEGHIGSRAKFCLSEHQTFPLGLWLDQPYQKRGK